MKNRFNGIRQRLNNPRFRHGSNATIFTVVVVAIIAVIYAITIALSNKYDLSLDLTKNNLFQLTDESINFIKDLDSPITISVLNSKETFESNEYTNQVTQIFKMYEKYGKNIKVDYVDIAKNPSFVSKYPSQQLDQSSIIVQTGERYKIISVDDLFEVETKSSKAEQALTSAIMYITMENKLKVAVIEGHEEYNTDGFKKLLQDNLYDVSSLNLMTSDIPQDTSMLIIAAPNLDYTKDEINKLSQFLNNNGKNIFYFASLNQGKLPNITSLLSEWGIKVEDAIAFEQDAAKRPQISDFSAIVEYTNSDIFKNLVEQNTMTLFLQSKPVTFIESQSQNYKQEALISFSSSAVGLTPELSSPDQATIKGPFAAIAKSSKITTQDATPTESSVIVSGSIDSINPAIMFNYPTGNGSAYIDIVNNACGKDQSINIVAKDLQGSTINLTQKSATIIQLVFMIFVPVAVLALGLSVWSTRRNK